MAKQRPIVSVEQIETDPTYTYFKVKIGDGGRFHPDELFYMVNAEHARYVWRVDEKGNKTQIWDGFANSGPAMVCNAQGFIKEVFRVYARNGYKVVRA